MFLLLLEEPERISIKNKGHRDRFETIKKEIYPTVLGIDKKSIIFDAELVVVISAFQQLPVTLVPPSFLKAKFHLSWINVMLSLIE